ncbi:pectate lyase [Paraflavitalea sp. CAU 1676]|uniref:pectate lyase family protein n=1 Tax=Paraflavitalea sp. CAU 1676 TaxID=3032598 RepID=UPI0023DB1003|nr:pectate lyase [Paraflavitalea sp. CAU 1676]MDF2189558.1 pectate lyase [Paraflavitalea sp. CAU 1676]
MKRTILTLAWITTTLISCTAQQKPVTSPDDPQVAFPGAEGFGRYATGGRGGKVFIVNNLNDAGPGSFREAASAKASRIIVFAVSGTIHLNTRLTIAGNVTIAGQSAPGDGICLADQPVNFGGDNIIIRFLRFRMGDKYQKGGMVDGNGADDALGGTKRKHLLIDHCSLSWSTDEVMSIYAGDSSTLQWNLIAEPLNYSYHFETGDKDYERHGYGGIWGGRHLSAHHNLIAHCNSRTPRFDGIRNAPEENVDYRNNVIYNWGHNNTHAGEGGRYNIVNNYYKYGPSTGSKVRFQFLNPFNRTDIPYGKFYVEGNYVDGSTAITTNNWLGVKVGNGGKDDEGQAKLDQPIAIVPVNTQTAEKAYELVLQQAGAIRPKRDIMDQRIIRDVQNRTGGFVDVQGGFPHGTAYELTVTAWPALQATAALVDSDQDGMPDAWEKKHQLNAADARDASAYTLNKGYTNIEIYLHELAQ